MNNVETDNQERNLSVRLNTQSVQTSTDYAPTDNSEGKNNAGGAISPAQNFSEISIDRLTTDSCDQADKLLDIEMQKQKYIEWVNSGAAPKLISLLLPSEEGGERLIKYSVAFVDFFRLKRVYRNRPLRFWACDPVTKQREFILFEYWIPDCKFKAVVQDLNDSFTIGLNIKRESPDSYSVIVNMGDPDTVRDNVQRQLRQDFDGIYGEDNSVRTLTANCFADVKRLLRKLTNDPVRIAAAAMRSTYHSLSASVQLKMLLFVAIALVFAIVSPYIALTPKKGFEPIPTSQEPVIRTQTDRPPQIERVVAEEQTTENEETVISISKPLKTVTVTAARTAMKPDRKPPVNDDKEPPPTDASPKCEHPPNRDPFRRSTYAARSKLPVEDGSYGPEMNEPVEVEHPTCADGEVQ